MSDVVSFKDLARRLGIDPTTVRRLIERYGSELGIAVQKGRGNTSNAKWTHYLTREDADRLAGRPDLRREGIDFQVVIDDDILVEPWPRDGGSPSVGGWALFRWTPTSSAEAVYIGRGADPFAPSGHDWRKADLVWP